MSIKNKMSKNVFEKDLYIVFCAGGFIKISWKGSSSYLQNVPSHEKQIILGCH